MHQSTFVPGFKFVRRLLLGLVVLSSVSLPLTFAEVQTGQEAPDFTLMDQNGKSHTLSQYKGKVVVLEWTNPTCPFVEYHYQQKTMTKLAQENPKVVWLTINSSYFTTTESNQKWATSEGVKTVLADASGVVGQKYNARTTPHMYVVNPEGKLVYQGAIDDNPHMDNKKTVNYVRNALESLRAGQPIKTAKTAAYGCSVKYKR